MSIQTPTPIPAPGDLAVPMVESPGLPTSIKTFAVLTLAHAMVDCLGGVWPIFKFHAGLDLAFAGTVATVAGFAASLSQPLFGLWADRGHQRRFLLLGMALVSLLMLLGPIGHHARLSPSPLGHGLMWAIMLVGTLGLGMFHPAGASLAGNLLPAHRSTFIAIFVAVGAVGFAISQGLFALVYTSTRGHTEILLIPAAGVWAAAWFWCHPPSQTRGRGKTVAGMVADLWSSRGQLLALFLILSLNSGVTQGLFFLMPEFLAWRGYPSWLINGGAFGLIVIGSAAMMVPAGLAADRLGRRGVLAVSVALSLAGFYAWVLLPTAPVGVFVGLCLLAGGLLGVPGPLGVALGQHLAPHNISVISGVMMGLAWAVGAAAPLLVAFLVQSVGLGPVRALAYLGLANIIALALTALLPRDSAAAEGH